MLIHVSRDGQQFGPYTPEDVQAYQADGSLLNTALGWVEGTADWVPLSQLVNGNAAPPPAILGITLTKRHDMPMAGIPFHAVDNYITKLLDAGKKVAFCDLSLIHI